MNLAAGCKRKVSLALMAAVGLWMLSHHPLNAGGSLPWSEVKPMVAALPELQRLLDAEFEIDPNGTANRLGRAYGNLSGRRVGPYEFRMRLSDDSIRQTDEVSWPWLLRIETDWEVLDSQGRPVQAGSEADDLELIERNPRIMIVAPSRGAGNGAVQPAADQAAMRHSEEEAVLTMEAFERLPSEHESVEVEFEDDRQARITFYRQNAKLRKIVLDYGRPGATRWQFEAFLVNGSPRCLLISRLGAQGEFLSPETAPTAYIFFNDRDGQLVSARDNGGLPSAMGPRGWENIEVDRARFEPINRGIRQLIMTHAPHSQGVIQELIEGWTDLLAAK